MLAIHNDVNGRVTVYTKAALDREARLAFKAEVKRYAAKRGDYQRLPWTISVNGSAVTLIVPILNTLTGWIGNHLVSL